MPSARAELRQLMRDIAEVVRKRFGEHIEFRVWWDSSDCVETDYQSCIWFKRTQTRFPDGPPYWDCVDSTLKGSLQQLLKAVKGE